MAFFKKEFHQHLADFFWLAGKEGKPALQRLLAGN
jgi:hypothetical protein